MSALGVVLGALLLGSTASASAQVRGPSWEKCRTAGACTLPVLAFPRAPFAFDDEKQRWTGFEVQMMELFRSHLAELGVEVELDWQRKSAFNDVLEGVRSGKGGVFAVSQVSIREERREEMAFSPPYMSNTMVLVTHEQIPELESYDRIAEAFAGLTALAIQGTTLEEATDQLARDHFPGLRIELLEASNSALQKIVAEPGCCFAFMDFPQFGSALRQGAPLRRHPFADEKGDRFAVAFPLGTDWQPIVDEFFASFVGSPDAEFLLEHFFGWEQGSTLRMDAGG